MLKNDERYLVFFDSESMVALLSNDISISVAARETVHFSEFASIDAVSCAISASLDKLSQALGKLSNKNTRLFATGFFQNFDSTNLSELMVQVYVHTGLQFNVIPEDLESFYLSEATLIGSYAEKLAAGMARQEFRRVVVCGSFQEHLREIGDVMQTLQAKGTEILSPWTTEVVPETLGTDFILLRGQELLNERDAWRHKRIHMDKFLKSDAVIVCNPGGHIGKGTMFEFGFMVAHNKRIILTEEPTDLTILFPYEVGLHFVTVLAAG